MSFRVDNYMITTPIPEIIDKLKLILVNGKLKDVIEKNGELVVTCPNSDHDNGHESHPDCHIKLDKMGTIPYGTFHCFACSAHGSFVDFIRHCFDSSIEYAKTWLISNFGTLAENYIDLGESINLYKRIIPQTFINQSELTPLQSWCPYLAKRHLSRETCEKFNIKYDPRYRQVVFPCYDSFNRIVMLAKRSIDTKTFYMDKDKPKPLYCFQEVYKNNYKKVMIVEGLIDTLSGWEHKIPTIGTLGTPSDSQISQLNTSGVLVVYCAFDNDTSGKRFTEQLKRQLNQNIIVEEINLPFGVKDVNDLSESQWNDLIKKYNLPQID